MSICEAAAREIFTADPGQVAAWERSVFDELAGAKQMVLCGAGGLGQKTLAGLRKVGVEPVAFSDNNVSLWGRSIEGVPVLPPQDAAATFGESSVFVVTAWGAHSQDRLARRKQQWTDLGCKTVVSFMPLFWKYPEVFLPHYACDLPHKVYRQSARILALCGLWNDDASRIEFVEQLRWRTQIDYPGLPEPVAGPTYFPEELFDLRADEQFVDCGAFDGDTLRDFLKVSGGKFSKFWALEPDPDNYRKLEQAVSALPDGVRSRINLQAVAASRSSRKLRFSCGALAASAISELGEIEVQGESLDALLEGYSPTYIKMDIEGGEPEALLGCADIFQRCRPIVAISAYHLQEHLWEIPGLLRDRLVNYSFHLYPHDREGWDLVCYAVPLERSKKNN